MIDSVANNYNGEIEIVLNHKKYMMKINMDVITKFQSKTGNDFMRLSTRAMNALRKTVAMDAIDQAEVMTAAVSMTDAAWLFFIAAKEMDSTVLLEEMQENVLHEGRLQHVELGDGEPKLINQSYPILFAQLVMFAVLGVTDDAKKQ